MVQTFRKIAKNHMNINFHDKNFVITRFFHDYLCAVAPVQTIHIVTPSIILTHACGTGLSLDNNEPFRILVLRHAELSIHLDTLRRRDTYGRLLTFVIRLL